MLKANQITKRYGDRLILDGVSFVVNSGECAGIVAPNGAGKTTLLDILAGRIPADSGSIERGSGDHIAYVRQGFAHDAQRNVADVFPAAMRARQADHALADAANALATATTPDALDEAQAAYDAALETAASSDGDDGETWRELGLREIGVDELVGNLSGGEQTKLALLNAFAVRPDVLLLDEPTNNLDMPAAAWLGERIASFLGAIVLVSHDRALLDEHATSIIEIDPHSGRAETFAGNYSDWAAEKQRRRDQQWSQYRRQLEQERRVKQEISDIKNTATKREHLSQNDFYRRKAKKVARRAVVLERRLTRELASGTRVEKPRMTAYRLQPRITAVARGGDRMLRAEDVSISIAGRDLLANVTLEIGWAERVIIIGANGSGKTTLLRALVGAQEDGSQSRLGDRPSSSQEDGRPRPSVVENGHSPSQEDGRPRPSVVDYVHSASSTQGTITTSPSTKIGYLPQEQQLTADDMATPLSLMCAASALSETEARRFLHRFLFEGDSVHTSIASLSYGERRRLSLATLVLSGANLLILDEPTNHLDIPSREALESALQSYDGAIIAVTHDRYFVERFAQRLLLLDEGRLREVRSV